MGSTVPGLGVPWLDAIGEGVNITGDILDMLGIGGGPRKEDIEYQNRQATAYNDFLKQYGEAGKQALEMFKAAGYDPFGPQVTTQTGTTSGLETYDETTTPFITKEYAPLAGLQRALVERRLSSPTGLPAGYEETGISAINQAAEGALNAERNFARNRGIDPNLLKIGSPAERSRRQQIARFRVETPLKARALQTEDIGLAQGILQAFGRAEKKKGRRRTTGTSTGTTTAPPSIQDILPFIMPQGPRATYYGKIKPSGLPEYGSEGA